RLDPAILKVGQADRAAAVLALRALLGVAGGTSRLPDVARAQALFAQLGEGTVRATLSRAVVDARRSGIWIRREVRAVPTLRLKDAAMRWDGRWRVSGDGATYRLSIAPLGADLADGLVSANPEAPESLARAALSLEPALFVDGTFV